MPETFIVGRDGRIAYKLVGPITSENLDTVIKPEIEKALGAAGSPMIASMRAAFEARAGASTPLTLAIV